jgi:hypothetical protein
LAAKKTFVLRIDEDTFKAIERWASDEFRSVNGHLEWLIDKALKDSKRKKRASPTEAGEGENIPNAPGGEEPAE